MTKVDSYTDVYYQIINHLWKTIKPYAEQLDDMSTFDDGDPEDMANVSDDFAKTHVEDFVKGDPDLNREICESCYHLLQAIAISAEREGCLKLEKGEDEQIKGQQGMFENSY